MPDPRDIGDAPTLVSPEPPASDLKPGARRASLSTIIEAKATAHRPMPPGRDSLDGTELQEPRILSSSRFDISRRLGSGSFGVVYDAFDRQRQTRVALKTLHLSDLRLETTTVKDAGDTVKAGTSSSSGAAREQRSRRLYALKQEFRKLATISHPNVASLYELGVERGEWFIAMELVPGVEFLDWVRPVEDSAVPPLDLPRLRVALRGLAKGVHALHGQGILHSDLKPSNVLVTPRGRTVILDFGLVALQDPQMGGAVSGTPEFMSPEQAVGDETLTEASDWYAVGSMLYYALTNTLPYEGPFLALVLNKTSKPPTPIKTLNPEAPDDLVALCEALMAREVEDRPTGEEILRSLGVAISDARALGGSGSQLCVGREDELRTLARAASTARDEASSVVFVSGPSGIGKSCLMDAFLGTNQQDAPHTAVLSGRCFAQESVPYKALDGVIDALHGALLCLPPDRLAEVLPPDTALLGRAFPVLAGLAEEEQIAEIRDDQERKLQMMRVLRQLFVALAKVHPVLVVIDDVQWADSDSVVLLSELLRPPEEPAMCVVMLYRSEDVATSEVLAALRQVPHLAPGAPGVTDISVGTLPTAAAVTLIGTLAEELTESNVDHPGLTDSDIAVIAQESGGEPFLITEYVRLILDGGSISRDIALNADNRKAAIDGLLAGRIQQLPATAQALLGTIGTAGVPVDRSVATAATDGLGDGEGAQALVALEAAGMIRRLGAPFEHIVETYHDRIRSVAAAWVPEARRPVVHGALGRLLEANGSADPETLMVHFAEAREHEAATNYALKAAAKADTALAFDRAASLYERAVELGELAEGTEQLKIRVALGDAYRNAGRGAEAAQAYLGAARYCHGVDALRLRARASAQYLQAGHTDDGIALSRDVLSAVGERLPASRKAALARMLGQRARLAVRGLSFKETHESEVDPQALIRMDMCYEVSTTFAIIDDLVGSLFGARYLLQALDAGEPKRLSLAMGIEACFLAATGKSQSTRVTKLLETSENLAAGLNEPFLDASAEICRGVVTWSEGRFADSLVHCEAALEGFTTRCVGVPWDRAIARFYKLYCQRWLGHFNRLKVTVPAHLSEADACGDRYTQAYIRYCFLPQVAMASDSVELDDLVLDAAPEDAFVPAGEKFEMRHWWQLGSYVEACLYWGDTERGLAAIQRAWRRLQLSLILSIEPVRVEALFLRSRCALAAAATSSASRATRNKHLREARRCVRKMRGTGWAWGSALGALVSACIATFDDPNGAMAEFFEAQRALESAQLPMHAAVARWHGEQLTQAGLGEAEGVQGLSGRRLGEAFGITAPERYARMVAPVSPASESASA